MKILCSTGALIGRPNNRNYRLLAGLAGKLSCDGFEFLMYDTWYEEWREIVKYLKEAALPVPVMHCEKQIGEAISKGGPENLARAFGLFEINCEMAAALGAGKLVVHLWDGLTSDSNEQSGGIWGAAQDGAGARHHDFGGKCGLQRGKSHETLAATGGGVSGNAICF